MLIFKYNLKNFSAFWSTCFTDSLYKDTVHILDNSAMIKAMISLLLPPKGVLKNKGLDQEYIQSKDT